MKTKRLGFLLGVCLCVLSSHSRQVWGDTWGRSPEYDLASMRVAFSPDAKRLAISGHSQGVELWDTQTQTLERKVMLSAQVGNAAVDSLAFSRDGHLLACGRPNETILLWKTSTGEKLNSLGDYGGLVTAAAFSPRNHMLAGGTCHYIDLTPESEKNKPPVRSPRGGPTFRPFKTTGEITVRDMRTNMLRWTVKWEEASLSSLAFSPDGRTLAALGGTLGKLYDARTGKLLHDLSTSFSYFCGATFSPDGRWLVASNDHNEVVLVDVRSGTIQHTFRQHGGKVWSVAFSPNGKFLASASSDNSVHLCDVDTGQLIRILPGMDLRYKEDLQSLHGDTALRCVAFSPNGHQVIAAGFGYDHFGGAAVNIAIQHWNVEL